MNDYTYNYSYPTTSTASAADFGIMLLLQFLIGAVIYVIYALLLSRIFKKAGVPQWIAWVPVYNVWKLLELGGQQGFWSILAFVPVVSIVSVVFLYIAMYHVGKNLGKSGAFVLWAIFVPLVWLIWLAADKSKWGDKLPSTTA